MAAGATTDADDKTVIYRLDLPAELAAPLAEEAEANERTMPGQVRHVIRQWLSSRNG
ncbi:hypothetical protein OGCDGJMD_01254 [Cyanobium usitatum str. Tous]|jgi:hypothetical protein|uniref:hypothetical protein n=1 Tax=Cyanobium usitatum TaxID=2304190 RepID=UPI002AD42E4C|nr:hypothetical protein [Cyanobium usitatum]CAK6692546.1 hypothetical protein OGCDGJMD_01254 [Cyanobium usitatum str. Tous]